jgi:hypothetical protein
MLMPVAKDVHGDGDGFSDRPLGGVPSAAHDRSRVLQPDPWWWRAGIVRGAIPDPRELACRAFRLDGIQATHSIAKRHLTSFAPRHIWALQGARMGR